MLTVAGRSGRATLELGAHQLALRNGAVTDV